MRGKRGGKREGRLVDILSTFCQPRSGARLQHREAEVWCGARIFLLTEIIPEIDNQVM